MQPLPALRFTIRDGRQTEPNVSGIAKTAATTSFTRLASDGEEGFGGAAAALLPGGSRDGFAGIDAEDVAE
jgi:hypothetical protein